MSVGFWGEVGAKNLNLGIVSVWLVFKGEGQWWENNRAFGNRKEVAWCRIKNSYGLRLLVAGVGNKVKSSWRKMLMTIRDIGWPCKAKAIRTIWGSKEPRTQLGDSSDPKILFVASVILTQNTHSCSARQVLPPKVTGTPLQKPVNYKATCVLDN